MWIVYDHPSDFPDQYVVRRWEVWPGLTKPTDEAFAAEDLGVVRAAIPPDAERITGRDPHDPCILETWL